MGQIPLYKEYFIFKININNKVFSNCESGDVTKIVLFVGGCKHYWTQISY